MAITAEMIKVKLHGSGEVFTLPPFIDELEEAPPGGYKLRSTGELWAILTLLGASNASRQLRKIACQTHQ